MRVGSSTDSSYERTEYTGVSTKKIKPNKTNKWDFYPRDGEDFHSHPSYSYFIPINKFNETKLNGICSASLFIIVCCVRDLS